MNRIKWEWLNSRLRLRLWSLFGRVGYGPYFYMAPLKSLQQAVGPGWADLIKECFEVCRRHAIIVLQVKEKYGGLRFYIGAAPMWIHEFIHEMEELSYLICEECGAPGKLRTSGWYRTLCDNCDTARRK